LEVYPEFGSHDFFDFVAEMRSLCIEKACVNSIEGLIVTVCYDKYLDKKTIKHWIKIIESNDGIVMPIYLKASINVLNNRVSNESRVGTKKLQTASSLESTLNKYNFGPIEEPNSLIIDTELKSASESVSEIIEKSF